ncbi:MAG: T9SS type A sorting domain-containing protein [Agriterribacter sp.]
MNKLTLLIASLGFVFFCYAQAPTISGFTPLSAAPGMNVVITGTNFSTATVVTFNGVSAGFTVNSATQITAVVPVASSGVIQVTNPDGSGSRSGFIYVPTSGIITDFGGYWSATGATPGSTNPNNSHHLLAFTHNGVTYSTGVNNSILTNNSVTYTPGNFKALPVAAIAGTSTGSGSVFLAMAALVDGSGITAYVPGVASNTIRSVLTDGTNGLDLGTGITNLPSSATMTFQIYNINSSKIDDDEPDIILTQIADPSTGNDVFAFVDASGNVVGNTFTQNMQQLPRLGTYTLDLFSLQTSTPYNTAKPITASTTNGTRDIRLVAVKLSDFGITSGPSGNYASVKGLRITPSSSSDYAFIAYNANAINLPPNVDISAETSTSKVCSGGTASLDAIGTATSGGTLSYSWEESTDNGTSWHSVSDGGNYSGAATSRLVIANAVVGNRYRAVVNETDNANPGTSDALIITAASGTQPSAVSITGGGSTVCRDAAVTLNTSVTGGSNLTYQWQSNAGGTFEDISGAISARYYPPTNATGTTGYRVRVSYGSGCAGAVTSASSDITVNGISSVTPAARCEAGTVTLNATATASPIDWYNAESGGTSLGTGASFTTPSISATTTYYAAISGCDAASQRVPVIATVYPASVGGAVLGAGEVASGTNSTTLTLSANTGSVVKWQSSVDTFNLVINDIDNTSAQYTATNLTQNTQYRVVVQSGTCATATSAIAYMRVTGTLPIRNNSITLSESNATVVVQWETYDQPALAIYEVERSADGIHFTTIGSIPATANAVDVYKWTDANPAAGLLYYRVKEVLKDGDYHYSNIVSIRLKESRKGLRVYPNPVDDNMIRLQFSGMQAGKYTASIFNASGQKVFQGVVQHTGNTSTQLLSLTRKLPHGVYRLRVEGGAGFRKFVSLVIK